MPLMKAELWKEVEDGYAQLLRNKAYTTIVQINYCVPDDNYPNQFKYHCESMTQTGALLTVGPIFNSTCVDFFLHLENRAS